MVNPSLSKSGESPIVPVRLPVDVKKAAMRAAKKQGVSLSVFIRTALVEKLEKPKPVS